MAEEAETTETVEDEAPQKRRGRPPGRPPWTAPPRDTIIEVKVALPGQRFSEPVRIVCPNSTGAVPLVYNTVDLYIKRILVGLRGKLGRRVKLEK